MDFVQICLPVFSVARCPISHGPGDFRPRILNHRSAEERKVVEKRHL